MKVLSLTIIFLIIFSNLQSQGYSSIVAQNEGGQDNSLRYRVAAVNSGYKVTYSSRYSDEYQQTWDGYQLGNTISVWEPSKDDAKPWIQVCTEELKQWTGLTLQGRGTPFAFSVNTFLVQTSVDGKKFDSVDDGFIFNYSQQNDPNIQQDYVFQFPVSARTLRIVPLTFTHYVAVRFEAYFDELV